MQTAVFMSRDVALADYYRKLMTDARAGALVSGVGLTETGPE